MVARPFSFPNTNSLQIKNMNQDLEREVSSIKPFSLPGRGNISSGAPSGPMTSSEPRVAGQSPKHTLKMGRCFLQLWSAPGPMSPSFGLLSQMPTITWVSSVPSPHQLWAVLPSLPSLSSQCSQIICVGVCSPDLISASSTKLQYGRFAERCTLWSLLLAILTPCYPATAAFKMLCLRLFQRVPLFSATWGSMVCFCLMSVNHYNTAQMCENLSLRLYPQPAVAGEKVVSVSHHAHVLRTTSTKISFQVPRPDSIRSYPK